MLRLCVQDYRDGIAPGLESDHVGHCLLRSIQLRVKNSDPIHHEPLPTQFDFVHLELKVLDFSQQLLERLFGFVDVFRAL